MDITFQSLERCTLGEITALWNEGFSEYLNDMSYTEERMAARLKRYRIDLSLSVAVYLDGQPAGFVQIGVQQAHGVKTAWNAGTGIHPACRGKGVGKELLQEAIRRLKGADVHSFSLETRVENKPAIALYQRVGFESVNRLSLFENRGVISPFPLSDRVYTSAPMAPEALRELPFYLRNSRWIDQWFHMREDQTLVVCDAAGDRVGYALFDRERDEQGNLKAIHLKHCEVKPGCPDPEGIVSYLLQRVFAPYDEAILRTAYYVPSSNDILIAMLLESGFSRLFEEHLMLLNLQ